MPSLAQACPLLLADAEWGQLIGIAFIVLSFLSWFVKQLKGGGEEAAPEREKRAAEKNKPLRSEIEEFLEELRKPSPEPVAAPKPEPPRKAGPVVKPKSEKVRKSRSSQAPPLAVERPKPAAQVSQTSLAEKPLGESVRTHLKSYMSERVAAEARQHLASPLQEGKTAMVGQHAVSGAESPAMRRGEQHPLLVALAQPGAIRQNFVLAEILQKPRALRSRKF